MSRVIEVTVSPAGEVSVQTKGFVGSSCHQASKFLEDSLGVSTADRMTSEYYENEQVKQEVKQ